MDSPSESSEEKPEGGRAAPDPLASPTLAALYASQGHMDVAELIYDQLGGQPAAGAPAAVSTLLQRLLSLREAARQARNAGYRARKLGG
jgi:hypothetical protein